MNKEDYKIVQTRIKGMLLNPLRIFAYLTAVAGVFALYFEVTYFREHSLTVYYARYIAIAVSFWVLVLSYIAKFHKYIILLIHILLLSIIISFGIMIFILPKTLMVNSSIAALILFTAAVFLSWDVKNQIIVAIYYNLCFAFVIFMNTNNVYLLPNLFETVILVLFLTMLSIVASWMSYGLKTKILEKSIQIEKSEKKYKDIFENSVDGLFNISKDGNFKLANTALKSLLGIDEKEMIENLNFYKDFIYNTQEGSKLLMKLKFQGEVKNYILAIKTKSGEKKFIKLNLKNIIDDQDEIIKSEGSLQDVTQEIEVREELISAKNQAEEADKLKTEFLAQMSHEIRTPLNALATSVQLLKSDFVERGSQEWYEIFDIIDSTTKRIIRTIDLILNMSQIQSGTYKLSHERFNINDEIFKHLLLEYYPTAESKGIKLTVDPKSANITVNADKYTVTQIFANLIDNALKYTHRGEVRVSAEEIDGKIYTEVLDTGIGISEEYLPKLFQPFSQEFRGYSRKFEGNGLGMALVKKYCDMNNAKILVESKKSVGTKFTVIFK